LQERSQLANRLQPLHPSTRVDQLSRLARAEHRRDQISRLVHDFLPRHRVPDGSANRIHPLDEARSVVERDFDDRHARRQQLRERFVLHQLHLRAMAEDRRSFIRGVSCTALNVAVLSTSMTAIMCCRLMSGRSRLSTTSRDCRRQPHDHALHVVGLEPRFARMLTIASSGP
jgi:hypothetical protein